MNVELYRWLSDEARSAKRTADVSSDGIDVLVTRLTVRRRPYAAARSAARDAVLQSRSDDIKQRFVRAAGDHVATWRVTNDVLHRRHAASVRIILTMNLHVSRKT